MPQPTDLTERINDLLARARELSEDELEEIARIETERSLTSQDQFNLGDIYRARGDYYQACRRYGDCVALFGEDAQPELAALCMVRVGESYSLIGDYLTRQKELDMAVSYYEDAAGYLDNAIKNIGLLPDEDAAAAYYFSALTKYNSRLYQAAILMSSKLIERKKLHKHLPEVAIPKMEFVLEQATKQVGTLGCA